VTAVPTTVDFPEPIPAERRGKHGWAVESDGREVALTNLDKPYWGPEGYTKADLLAYYWNAAGHLLPYLRDRPLTLKRMPEGAEGPFFYAKQVPPGAPPWLRTAGIEPVDGSGRRIDYVLADDRAGVLWLANAGCIELHPWHGRIDNLGHPDYAFFDLDPMGAASFDDVRVVAGYVRTLLDQLGVEGHPRTSGATGMQVYVPLDRSVGLDAGHVRAWVGAVCRVIERADPARTTMTWDIAARGDRVFLDHNMNTEGKNIAATWCLRPERAAPVATPLAWDEVTAGITPTDSTIATVWPRMSRPDPFLAVLAGGQDLRPAMAQLGVQVTATGARHRVVAAGGAGSDDEPAAVPPDLERYRAKRDFTRTAEPAPDDGPGDDGPGDDGPGDDDEGAGPRFVVQHHLATRLHHDLRLERDGVAVSFAVPKGLPEAPGVRHLVVPTEDHPLRYLDFSGSIPQGEYGGGEMRIWDHGTYETVEWIDGKITVRLFGRRHTGEYHLFRTGPPGQTAARGAGGTAPKEQWLVTHPAPPERVPAPPPAYEPMLAAAHAPPWAAEGWVYEVKWDGVRVIARTTRPGWGEDGATRLSSRAGNDVTAGYPELWPLWERVLAVNAVLDGEVVALDDRGRPSFERLQTRMHLRDAALVGRARARSPVTYVVFDLLAVDGEPLVDRPLADRLALLDDVLVPGASVVRSQPVEDGRALLAAVTKQGLEGVVGKRLAGRYQPGRRSDDWRKAKALQRLDVTIGGWLPGTGSRRGSFGALLVGCRDDHDTPLRYAGRVGTGFDDAELRRLAAILAEHETDASPFEPSTLPPEVTRRAAGARWCRPDLVCTVEYLERTSAGRLRAPSYKGLVDP